MVNLCSIVELNLYWNEYRNWQPLESSLERKILLSFLSHGKSTQSFFTLFQWENGKYCNFLRHAPGLWLGHCIWLIKWWSHKMVRIPKRINFQLSSFQPSYCEIQNLFSQNNYRIELFNFSNIHIFKSHNTESQEWMLHK